MGILFIGVIAVTYCSYIYGYNSADIETLKMALSEDQSELARTKGIYKDENDAINNIVNDRRNMQNAYSQGYNNGNTWHGNTLFSRNNGSRSGININDFNINR